MEQWQLEPSPCGFDAQWQGVPGPRSYGWECTDAERRMTCAGMTNVIELAERRCCRPSTSAASWSDSERHDGVVFCRH